MLFQPQVFGGQPERRARRVANVRTQLDGDQDGERGRLQCIQDLKNAILKRLSKFCCISNTQT